MTADTTAGGSGGSSPLASTGRPTLTRLGSVKLRAAFTISSTGDWIYKFAVPTLILHLTGSALDTAFAYVLEFIPYVVVGPFAGVLADRLSRRGTMIVCDYSSCALALIIAGLVQLGHPAIALLYLCALALSCTRPIYFPAFQGFLVEMVRPDDRPRFNSWTEITDSLLSLAGPVLGVSIVAAAGVPLATVLDAVSFAVSATLVATIAYRRLVAPEAPARRWITGVLSDLGAGLRIVGMSRAILAGTVLLTASNLAAYVIEGNLVYVVLNVEHHAKIALGVVFALQGAGGVVGAFGAPRLLPGRPAGRLIVVGAVADDHGRSVLRGRGLRADRGVLVQLGAAVDSSEPHRQVRLGGARDRLRDAASRRVARCLVARAVQGQPDAVRHRCGDRVGDPDRGEQVGSDKDRRGGVTGSWAIAGGAWCHRLAEGPADLVT